MMIASVFVLLVMVVLLCSSMWIGFALLGTGLLSLEWFRDVPIQRILAQDVWSRLNADELVTLPLFVLMGDILFFSKLSESLFRGIAPWVQRLPGGLLHVNVIGCTIFAAVSGSSAATTATVGRMTLRELLKRGYDKDMAMGSLAGAGTIGLMIPPSIPMIVYGVLADVSILDLFIAGVVPGLIIAVMFIGWIMLQAWWRPSVQPADPEVYTWAQKVESLKDLLADLVGHWLDVQRPGQCDRGRSRGRRRGLGHLRGAGLDELAQPRSGPAVHRAHLLDDWADLAGCFVFGQSHDHVGHPR
jgi:C4-dicarboxylate transporter DctM subunit